MKKYDMQLQAEPGSMLYKIFSRIRKGSSVLEMGCSYGRMTRYMKEELQCKVSIVELDEESFLSAKQYAEDGYCGNLERLNFGELFSGRQYDYIIFADVLEHLMNPGDILAQVKPLLKDDGEVIISIPNICHNDVLSQLYLNCVRYTSIGLMDDTHIHFWGRENINSFARASGYDVLLTDAVYVSPFSTEQNADPKQLPAVWHKALSMRDYNDVYQYFLVLKKEEWIKAHGITPTAAEENHSAWSGIFHWDTHDEAVSATRLEGDSFVLTAAIPSSCRQGRLELCVPHPCLITALCVQADGEACEMIPSNGISVGEFGTVYTDHPQYDLSKLPAAKLLSVTVSLQPLEAAEAEGLSAFRRTCDRQVSQLQKEAKQYRQALQRVEENTQLLARQMQSESVQREQSLQQAEQKLQQAEQKLQENEQKLQQAEQKLQEDEQKLQESAQKLQQSDDDVMDLRLQTRRLRKDIEILQNSNLQLQIQFQIIAQSACWKMTKPIRVVLDFLKRTKLGAATDKAARYLKDHGLRKTLSRIGCKIIKREPTPEPTPEESLPTNLQRMVELAGAKCSKLYVPKHLKLQKDHGGCKVLLISHELNLTGAPIALQYLANTLSEQGDLPIVMAPNDGGLGEVFCKDGILSMVYPEVYRDDFVLQCADLFDLIIVNTIVGAPLIGQLGKTDVPVLWWIHEARVSYEDWIVESMPKILPDNIHVYCVGAHAKKMLACFRPHYRSKHLLYCVPDHAFSGKKKSRGIRRQTTFAIVGMQEDRKGFDIFIQAIRMLAPETLAQCRFIFVGRRMHEPTWEALTALLADYPGQVTYTEELKREEMFALYEQIDCLVCPSRDDPMPIVVTEAMLMGKLVICSENTGSAAILKKENAGLVYGNNDPSELAKQLIYVCTEKGKALLQMPKNARRAYEAYFSKAVFAENIRKLTDALTAKSDTERKMCRRSLHMFVSAYHTYEQEGDFVFGEKLIKQYDFEPKKKKVLLITHELSLTGAPIVLQYFAESLMRDDTQVVMISPSDGPLRRQLEAKRIPTIVYDQLYYSDFLKSNADAFDLIVPNTVVAFRCISQLESCHVPVLWWIHDSLASYQIGGFADIMPKELPANTHVVCAGEYAREQLLKYYPAYSAGVLYYSIPDEVENPVPLYDLGCGEDEISFAVVGLQDHRKGQDIYADAIELLTEEERAKARFFFIGKNFEPKQKERIDAICQKYPDKVRHIPQLSRAEMMSMYRQCTCIVCSSRDDPLPVFITEAMMMSCIVICSEHTGSAPILEREHSGLVYQNDDPVKLAAHMSAVIADPSRFNDMCRNARRSFEQHFSQGAFDRTVQTLCREGYEKYPQTTEEISVSVVIPTYNAGEDATRQLEKIRSQKGIDRLEIIAVDSGSSDGTPEVYRAYGARVIEIPQSEFSHSYARNLGALYATGRNLIFMTQDAVPLDEEWMFTLLSPIVCGEASAVSCTEQCPEGTDLYYQIASWMHKKFLGVERADRLNRLTSTEDPLELRRKASLNDVTVAIDAKTFAGFLYRFDYAEDLDLGLRLLRAGRSVMIMHSTHTVHGHSRPAGYYIKRTFVDAGTLWKIHDAWRIMPKEQEKVARTVVYSAGLLSRGLELFLQKDRSEYDAEAFSEQLSQSLQEALQERTVSDKPLCDDPLYLWCLETLLPYSEAPCAEEADLFHAILYYIDVDAIHPYLVKNTTGILPEIMQKELLNCVIKQFCLMVGQELARLAPDMPLYDTVKSLGKGV